MYTRSYPRQDQKKNLSPPKEVLDIAPPQRILTENEIPQGYSGTAVLRENNAPASSQREATQSTATPVYNSPDNAQIHARKFKVATKTSPLLWHSTAEKTNISDYDNRENENYDVLSEISSELNSSGAHTGSFVNSEHEKNTDLVNDCINKEECYRESNLDENRCDKAKTHPRPRRRKLWRPSVEKHCFKRTHDACLRERSFSLEDLLLGGLILLMLNDGADDDIILIFAFLLFSSL